MKATGDVKNKIVSALFSRLDWRGNKHSQEEVKITAVRRDLGARRTEPRVVERCSSEEEEAAV